MIPSKKIINNKGIINFDSLVRLFEKNNGIRKKEKIENL